MSKSLLTLLFLFFLIGCKSTTHTYDLTVKVAPEYQQDIKGIAEILTKRLNHFELRYKNRYICSLIPKFNT